MDFITNPKAIETKSMSIIDELMGSLDCTPEELLIIKRVVHTSGDPEYAPLVKIHPKAIASGLEALKRGATIYTDVNMVKAGINSRKVSELGGEVLCYINDPEVVAEGERTGLTRAMLSMEKIGENLNGNIVVIGNAPTALFTVFKMLDRGITPALIIGTPVGFVGAAESKEILATLDIPHVTVEGTKGGSNIAAAITNALLYML